MRDATIRAVLLVAGLIATTGPMASGQAAGAFDATSGLDRARLGVMFETPAWRSLQLGVSARYGSDWSTDDARTSHLDVRAAVHRRFGSGGVWLGTRDLSGVNAGAWRRVGTATVSVAVNDRSTRVIGQRIRFRNVLVPDSVFTDSGWIDVSAHHMVADSSRTSQDRRWSEFEARAEWAPAGPERLTLGLSVIGGLLPWGPTSDSLSRASRMFWGHATAVLPLAPRLAVVGSAGVDPSVRDARHRSGFVTLGLRWTPASLAVPALPIDAPRAPPAVAAFAIAPAGDGTWTLSVRAPGARRLDVAGDFSGWKPVAMRSTSGRRWEVSLPLVPGTHRVNVRVDGGAWIVPAGLPAVDDEFNGRVGLFVVR